MMPSDTHESPVSSGVRLLRASEVCSRVGLKRPRIYALMRAGEFPLPVRIHGRSVAWRSDEIDRYIFSRPRAGQARNTNAPAEAEASRSAQVHA